jgi:hypothetical protein
MSCLHGHAQVSQNLCCLFGSARLAGQLFLQISALDKFQRKPGLSGMFADIKNLDDAGMLQLCDRFGLSNESICSLPPGMRAGQNHLDRDQTMQSDMASLVDDSHATATQLSKDFVVTDSQAGRYAGLRF